MCHVTWAFVGAGLHYSYSTQYTLDTIHPQYSYAAQAARLIPSWRGKLETCQHLGPAASGEMQWSNNLYKSDKDKYSRSIPCSLNCGHTPRNANDEKIQTCWHYQVGSHKGFFLMEMDCLTALIFKDNHTKTMILRTRLTILWDCLLLLRNCRSWWLQDQMTPSSRRIHKYSKILE